MSILNIRMPEKKNKKPILENELNANLFDKLEKIFCTMTKLAIKKAIKQDYPGITLEVRQIDRNLYRFNVFEFTLPFFDIDVTMEFDSYKNEINILKERISIEKENLKLIAAIPEIEKNRKKVNKL